MSIGNHQIDPEPESRAYLAAVEAADNVRNEIWEALNAICERDGSTLGWSTVKRSVEAAWPHKTTVDVELEFCDIDVTDGWREPLAQRLRELAEELTSQTRKDTQ